MAVTSKNSSKGTSATTPLRKNDLSQAESSQNLVEADNKIVRQPPQNIEELEPPRKRRKRNVNQALTQDFNERDTI